MTDILKSFSTLQSELDVAKSTLKGVDENIKRLIGRDPSDVARSQTKRPNPQNEERGRVRNFGNQNEDRRFKNSRLRTLVQENEEPPFKKRNTNISVFKRLSDRPVQDNNQLNSSKGMISKVIVTPKEFPSRQERMEAQSQDAGSVARNRRMFGALLGTLQKFQQEETKLKTREEKRAQLEKKIEEHEIKEKEEIKKERQELFLNRKKKQAEIKMIELKMLRMKEYVTWEDSQKHRINFIYTKSKPRIHFLPRKLNDAHKLALENSKAEIQGIIDKKREQVQEELYNIEERGKRMFESRRFQQLNKEQEIEEHSNDNDLEDDAMDHMDDLQGCENGVGQSNEEGVESTELSEEKEHNEDTQTATEISNSLNCPKDNGEIVENHSTEQLDYERNVNDVKCEERDHSKTCSESIQEDEEMKETHVNGEEVGNENEEKGKEVE